MMEHVVSMKNITKTFSGSIANDDVTLNLRKGTIHGLLGENGAGKTTLMNVLYGLNQPDKGEIFVKGEKVRIDSPSRAREMGIGMVHQHFMLVRPFTVVENIILGLESAKKPFLDKKYAVRKIEELCEKYKMKIDPYAKIEDLSIGEQQRVEILSAIYLGADILILDEPTAVLTPQEVKELFDILNMMRDDGKSIIFITHKLEEILEIGDEITVLRDGEYIDTVDVKETDEHKLTTMMVGREVLFDFSKSDEAPGDIVLNVDNIHAMNAKGLPALRGVSFHMRSNEVLGIAGVDGNGQKELCEVLTGIKSITEGRIELCGEALHKKSPREFIKRGISHIPEDRHRTGLVMDFSVMQNFTLKEFDTPRFSKFGFLKSNVIKDTAERLVKEYKIKTNGIKGKVKDLSGGNQQKVILGREIECNPKVIIANQPTRGLDIGAMEYVRQRLLDQKEQGIPVLLISADLEEIFQLADRVAVLYEGQTMGVLSKDELDINTIGLMMAGVKGGVEECIS